MRRIPPHKRAAQTGMTLVEVMMAMVLTAILLVGMNALWVEISREVDALVLRQKAIFRLNGEMERLTGLYSSSAAGATNVIANIGVATDYNTNVPANISSYIGATPDVTYASSNQRGRSVHGGERLIYPDPAVTPLAYVTNSASINGDFDEPAASANATLMSTGPGSMDSMLSRVYFWDTGVAAAAGSNRNLVWIDRSKKIVGQISWSVVEYNNTTALGNPGYFPCANGVPCRHITLYLDFPFRFESLISPRNEIDGLPIETITLQTIVAQR